MNTHSTQHPTESSLTASSMATYPFTWHRSPHLGQQSSQVELQTAAAALASTQLPQCTPHPTDHSTESSHCWQAASPTQQLCLPCHRALWPAEGATQLSRLPNTTASSAGHSSRSLPGFTLHMGASVSLCCSPCQCLQPADTSQGLRIPAVSLGSGVNTYEGCLDTPTSSTLSSFCRNQ